MRWFDLSASGFSLHIVKGARENGFLLRPLRPGVALPDAASAMGFRRHGGGYLHEEGRLSSIALEKAFPTMLRKDFPENEIRIDLPQDQNDLFPAPEVVPDKTPTLTDYDRFVVFFSGGKDSVASVLHLLESGVKPDQIELHHHLVDGREGSMLMDWPITESYCRAFAARMGMPIYFSWKSGGFEQEMTRNESRTAPIHFERLDGSVAKTGGDGGTLGTRMKFPQVAADLRTRWCSAYLKVDVGARVLTNEPRFLKGKTLVVTGERAEESSLRSKYETFHPHATDNRAGSRVQRHIDHWRPVHKWTETEIWDTLRRNNINPHPAYGCGFGRCSCMTCIFGSKDQWATIKKMDPERFETIARYEEKFGVTIQRTKSVRELAAMGTPYDVDPAMIKLAMSDYYPPEMLITEPDEWRYPDGAFGESAGPG